MFDANSYFEDSHLVIAGHDVVSFPTFQKHIISHWNERSDIIPRTQLIRGIYTHKINSSSFSHCITVCNYATRTASPIYVVGLYDCD